MPNRWITDFVWLIRWWPPGSTYKSSVIRRAFPCHDFTVFSCVVRHYNDVIMSAMASQITSLTIVYSTVYSDADQRKHQSSASRAFVRRIHRWPVKTSHKLPVTRKMLPFDEVIMNLLCLFSFATRRARASASHCVDLILPKYSGFINRACPWFELTLRNIHAWFKTNIFDNQCYDRLVFSANAPICAHNQIGPFLTCP